jgi:hypothetical protein
MRLRWRVLPLGCHFGGSARVARTVATTSSVMTAHLWRAVFDRRFCVERVVALVQRIVSPHHATGLRPTSGSDVTPDIETLAAVVRVLMVDSRQVTLSVARQMTPSASMG